MSPKGVAGTIVGVFITLIVVSGIFGSFYTVDQGQRGVILFNGAVKGTAGPGLHWKMPFVEDIIYIDVTQQSRIYDDVASYSRDQQTAHMKMSVNYRVPPDQVDVVYANFRDNEGLATRLLDRRVYEQAKNVFGQFNAATAIQDRARLNLEVQKALQDAVKGPILIDSVQIENIDFSDAYEKSIEDRMLAEVEVQKLKQNAEREKVQAQITVTKANAAADAVRADAQAQADATRLKGEAEADAIRAKGKALHDNPELVNLIQAEKWNGTLPTTMIPGSAVPFLNVQPNQ